MKPVTISRRGLIGSMGALAGSSLLFRTHYASASVDRQFPTAAALVDDYVASGKVAGMVAAIGLGPVESPRIISRGSFGRGDARAVDADSLFRIYSMTKPITGMAAMMLIDEGKLRLDQPVADLIPAFAKMQVQVTPDGSITDLRPAKTPITVRHLLTHTAGLGYSIVQKGPLRDAYTQAGLVPGRTSRLIMPGLDSPKPLHSLAEFAEVLATMPLVYEPGTQWSYSVGLDLLGRLIELASGQPFDAFLQNRIFTPAGMSSTGFTVLASQADRLTSNYLVVRERLVPLDLGKNSVYLRPPSYPFGGAGLISSPRDYDRFLQMLLGYGKIGRTRVMSEAAVRMGTSNLLPPAVDLSQTTIAGNGFGAGGSVGLGNDAGTYGWSGAAGTVGFVNFRVGIRAGVYSQYMPVGTYPLGTDFAKAVLADVTGKKAAA